MTATEHTESQATVGPIRLVVWGTYDLGKPRVRILLRGLRENGVEVTECHRDVWGGIEDKSQVSGWKTKLLLGVRWLGAYPALVYRYLRMPDHDAVMVCYMGQLDILILWAFAKLRRKPIVWDAFLSLYNTLVEDRRLVDRRHPLAHLLSAWEWLACRAADAIVLDTAAHGRYFVDTFRVPETKVRRIFVGVEPEQFTASNSPIPAGTGKEPFRVLFYGQFIPLHGIEHIVRAAHLCADEPILWKLIGKGQEEEKIRRLIAELRPPRLEWEEWVPYERLIDRIAESDLCLGIFADTDKAARVIPNKVFQVLAAGKPLVTRRSPATAELLAHRPGILLVPPADPQAIADAVLAMRQSLPNLATPLHRELRPLISPAGIGSEMYKLIVSTLERAS